MQLNPLFFKEENDLHRYDIRLQQRCQCRARRRFLLGARRSMLYCSENQQEIFAMQTLESERLILRNFSELDTDDLFRYACDPEVGPPAGWKPHETRAESLAIVRMFLAEDNVWAIERKSDRRVIGSLGFHKDKWRNLPDVRMFGYVLARDCWGNGYMSEAVKRAIEYAFTEANLSIVSVSHYTFNDRSRRVIEKCGFVREGTVRSAFLRYDGQIFDEALYSLTRQEWLAASRKA